MLSPTLELELLGSILISCKLMRVTRADRCGGMEGRLVRVQIMTSLAIAMKCSCKVMILETVEYCHFDIKFVQGDIWCLHGYCQELVCD